MLAPSKGYPEPWRDHRPRRLYPPDSSARLRPLTALILTVCATVWTVILITPVAMKAGEAKVNIHTFFENLR